MRLWEVTSKKRFCFMSALTSHRQDQTLARGFMAVLAWVLGYNRSIRIPPANPPASTSECSVTTVWSLLPISQSRAGIAHRGVDLVNHRHENRPHVPVSTSTNHSFVLFSVFICIHTYTYAGFGCNLLRYIPRLRKQEINAPLFTISFPGDFPGRHAAECAFTVERC